VQVGSSLALGGRAERPVQGHLQERVGDQGDQRGGHAGNPAEPLSNKRIWGWHMFRLNDGGC
jgi:hypothetical protein